MRRRVTLGGPHPSPPLYHYMGVPDSAGLTTVTFVAVCAAVDIRSRRIPNLLTGAGILAGLTLNTLNSGGAGLIGSVTGLFLTVAVLFLPFALGGIGGGDVKMLGAVGTLLGPRLALTGLGVGMIYGGAIMAVHLMRRGRLREKLGAIHTMVANTIVTRSIAPLRVRADDDSAVALPYSVPLGLGTITVLAFARKFGLS